MKGGKAQAKAIHARVARQTAPKAKPAPRTRAYRPAVTAEYRHLKAIVLRKYHKRVVDANHMKRVDDRTITSNLHAGAISADQARKAYAYADEVWRSELFDATIERDAGLTAIERRQ